MICAYMRCIAHRNILALPLNFALEELESPSEHRTEDWMFQDQVRCGDTLV